MTTSLVVSHITLGFGPDSQNKHYSKAPPPRTCADVALVDGASMSQSWLRHMCSHISSEEKTQNIVSPVESAGTCNQWSSNTIWQGNYHDDV